MGYSILATLHTRLGDTEKAFELFQRSYMPHIRPPFGALCESALSNNPYFVTRAGGMLHTLIFGFAGLRITEEGIIHHDVCFPSRGNRLI